MCSIQSEILLAEINEIGAELCKLRSIDSLDKYLWEGDTYFWSSSPLLFPIVGKLKNDIYTYDGKEYSLEKHGFAKKSVFKICENTANSVTLKLSNTEKIKTKYPFKFDLFVTYVLEENKLKVTHKICNKSETDKMYFSIGAHPGFLCDFGDYLKFSQKEDPTIFMLNNDFLLTPRKDYCLNMNQIIKIEKNTFDSDAIILGNIRSKSLDLVRKKFDYLVRVNFDTPYLGIWAKPKAPYVCIEPWYGIDDSEEKIDYSIEKKEGILTLDPQSSFDFSYSIEIIKGEH